MNGRWKWMVASAVLGAIIAVGVFSVKPDIGGGRAAAGDGTGAVANALAGEAQTDLQNRIIVVSQGTVQVDPDTAMISIGVQTMAQSAQEAQSQNSAQMQQVIDKLKEIGVRDDQIFTSGLSLYPEGDPMAMPENAGMISRYRAMNQVTVTTQEVARAAEILDAAIGAGANSNGNVSFTVKDDAKYREQALEEAVKAARPKAEAVARALGVTIKNVSVVEQSQGGPFGFGLEQAGMGGAGSKTPILPGQVSVVETVRVIFTY